MAHSMNTAATFYKADEETRRMMGSMGLGLGLGLGVGMGLEEEAGMVEQVKEDPELTGETQVMNETQFIFEFPGQEEDNTHNTTVEHEIHTPSSEYLLPIPLHSSSLSFHPDPSPLRLSCYNSNTLGGGGTSTGTTSTSAFQDLSSTSSVTTTAASACVPPLRTGSPTTEAMRSMMSVFRVDPFASYDVDAGSRRKRRKRGSSYAMLSDPEQTSREEPLMFTFQIDGMQDNNEYVNFTHLDSSAMLDGSLSTPSSPSMNILSSYSSNLSNYNTFLHSQTDDLSNMVLHTSEETVATAATTAAGGSGATAFGNIYTSYSPPSRHHHTFHNINMMNTNIQRHSHLHHNSNSNSNPSSNPVHNPSLSNTNYMLQNMQQNVGFNLDIGLGMGMDVSMNTVSLGGTSSFHNSVPGTNPPIQVPIPGVSPLSAASVPMNLGLSDTDANIGSSMSNAITPIDPLSTSISDFSGMIGHHHFSEEGEGNSWHSSHSHGSYPSHHHSPSQPRYQRRSRHHQSRHTTHTPQSQNQGFGNRLTDREEKQLRFPLDLSLTKLGGIHDIPQSIPESGREHESVHKYQNEEENQSQIDHSQGHGGEEHQCEDDKGNHRETMHEPQETQGLDQNQVIEYDDLSLHNVQVEDGRGINSGLAESEDLDLTLKTEVGQLGYPSPLPEDEEESANGNEYEEDGRGDGCQNAYANSASQKDGGFTGSDQVGFESGPSMQSKGWDEEKVETKKLSRRENGILENGRTLGSCLSSSKVVATDEIQQVHACGRDDDRDGAISSPAPSAAMQTYSSTNPAEAIYRGCTTQSSFDFNSFPLSSSGFDVVDHVDGDLVDVNPDHEGNETLDIREHEIPKREMSVASISAPSSTAWTGSGGLVFLPVAPPSAECPEQGDGRDDKDKNKGENDDGLGFWSRDVDLGLELEFEPGSRPGMEACSGPHPGLMFPQCDQWGPDEVATASKFTSSPPKPVVSSSSSVETLNAPLSTHHRQIQIPKLHSHNQFQDSTTTHTLNHYFNNPDDHVRIIPEHDHGHGITMGQIYTTSHPFASFLSHTSVSSESSISPTNIISMNTNYSSVSGACGPNSGGSRMHTCWICHKEFPRPSGLATHMNTHSGLKPYRCPVLACSKTFAVRSNARRHLRIHGNKIGSSVYCDANEGPGCSPTDASFSPSKFDRGRDRSLSPFTRSLSRQSSGSQRHHVSPRYRGEKAHPYQYPCAPPHSYFSRQGQHQFLRLEDRLLSPSLEQSCSTRIDESKSTDVYLSDYYDYYVEEDNHGVVSGVENEDFVPSGASETNQSSTHECITEISSQSIFSQQNFITSTPMSDTRPSSTSSMASSSTSSGSSMHTPNSCISEDPTVFSANPSGRFKPSEPLGPQIEAHFSQSIPDSVEMRMKMDVNNPPSTSLPTETLISMPIPQTRFGSSRLLCFE